MVVQSTGLTSLPSKWSVFKIVGDNVDKNVKPRFMHIHSQTRSLHYFHAYAVKDHLNLMGVSNT